MRRRRRISLTQAFDRRPRVSLTRLFDELNRQYFGGQLPRHDVRRVNRWFRLRSELRAIVQGRDPEAAVRSMQGCPLGDCHPRFREIRIANHLLPDAERQVLLHEMCHAAACEKGSRTMVLSSVASLPA